LPGKARDYLRAGSAENAGFGEVLYRSAGFHAITLADQFAMSSRNHRARVRACRYGWS
jgi:hypothetical protein